jgi:surface antigen
MKRLKTVIPMLVVALALSGCTEVRNQQGGALVGGALGGLVGSTIGRGDGRVAAAVAGALVGAYLGSNVGESMDELDRLKASRSMESTPTGSTAAWTNPDSGSQYKVTPTRTYYQDGGTPCREFTTEAWIDGKRESVVGNACRQSNGTWKTQ